MIELTTKERIPLAITRESNGTQQTATRENGPQQATLEENDPPLVTSEENGSQQATSEENDPTSAEENDPQQVISEENGSQQATSEENDPQQVTAGEHDANHTANNVENCAQQSTVDPQQSEQTSAGENDSQQITAAKSNPQQATTRNFDILNNPDHYEELLGNTIPDEVIDKLSCCSTFCRSVIPYLLLILLTTILCLAYLSFDLHPLACIVDLKEELITYNVNTVELKFSDSLLIFQKVAAILVLILVVMFLIFVKLFFIFSKQVIHELQQHVAIQECA